ncbi:MAG: hypothetical protein ACR2QM_16310 [Longimicrobiales bacterium]
MDKSQQAEADRRFQEALDSTGARDPRDYYRQRLVELRTANPAAYQSAVAYHRETLIPAVASGAQDPIRAWRTYGLEIAQLTAAGRTVSVDKTGKSASFSEPCPEEALVLHLPDGKGPALLVALPPEPSKAQKATLDWLVKRKRA